MIGLILWCIIIIAIAFLTDPNLAVVLLIAIPSTGIFIYILRYFTNRFIAPPLNRFIKRQRRRRQRRRDEILKKIIQERKDNANRQYIDKLDMSELERWEQIHNRPHPMRKRIDNI